MTPERKATIEALIARWQLRLRLMDWDIRVLDEEPSNSESVAEAMIWRKKALAIVLVSDRAPGHSLEREVVHELLHIVMDAPLEEWKSIAPQYVPASVCAVTESAAEFWQERAIEKLVIAFTGIAYISPEGCDHYSRAFPPSNQEAVIA